MTQTRFNVVTVVCVDSSMLNSTVNQPRDILGCTRVPVQVKCALQNTRSNMSS
jgi:hypothetical protein